jgi:hypothetical protein
MAIGFRVPRQLLLHHLLAKLCGLHFDKRWG